MIRLMALHKDPRTDIYYFRKVVPERLRPAFGKREFKVSLKTRNLTEARQKMIAPAAQYEQLAAEAAAVASGGWTELGAKLVDQWLSATGREERWLQGALIRLVGFFKARASARIGINPPAYAFESAVPEEGEDEALRLRSGHNRSLLPWDLRIEILKRTQAADFTWVVTQVARHGGRKIDPTDPLFNEVAIAFKHRLFVVGLKVKNPSQRQESIRPIIVIEGHRSGGEVLSSETKLEAAKVGLTISQAFEAWRNYTKGRPRKPQLVQEWGLSIRRFIAMYGDIDLGEIRAQMVRNYRDKLLELPGRAKHAIKALPLDEQAVIAARDGLETLAPATVNKSLSALRSVTEHVIEKMSHIALERNEAKGAKFVEINDSEDKRLPFEESDMRAIFRDLAITDSTGISQETLFWMVLLAPFTGCRLEEIGTLRPSNVRAEQGIWYIAIERDRAQVRAALGGDEKSRKNQNAERDIPLHPILLRSGFLHFVQRRRAEKAEWLFPDLQPNKYGKRTYRVSRLFAGYLEERGITDDEKVFHSFRHSIRRILRGRAPEEMVDLICGHSDGKVGRRYGRGADMRPLLAVINLIDYQGPDWNKVVATGRSYAGLEPESGDKATSSQLTHLLDDGLKEIGTDHRSAA